MSFDLDKEVMHAKSRLAYALAANVDYELKKMRDWYAKEASKQQQNYPREYIRQEICHLGLRQHFAAQQSASQFQNAQHLLGIGAIGWPYNI